MGKSEQIATEGVFCMSKYFPGLAGSVDIASGCNNVKTPVVLFRFGNGSRREVGTGNN